MGMFPVVGCPMNRDSFGLYRLIDRCGNQHKLLLIMQFGVKANIENRLRGDDFNAGICLA